eukprot:647919-Rhodomonas_salina.1
MLHHHCWESATPYNLLPRFAMRQQAKTTHTATACSSRRLSGSASCIPLRPHSDSDPVPPGQPQPPRFGRGGVSLRGVLYHALYHALCTDSDEKF